MKYGRRGNIWKKTGIIVYRDRLQPDKNLDIFTIVHRAVILWKRGQKYGKRFVWVTEWRIHKKFIEKLCAWKAWKSSLFGFFSLFNLHSRGVWKCGDDNDVSALVNQLKIFILTNTWSFHWYRGPNRLAETCKDKIYIALRKGRKNGVTCQLNDYDV